MRTVVFFSLICLARAALRLSTTLSASDQENLKNLFQETPYAEVGDAYHAVFGMKALSQGGALPTAVIKAACDAAKVASTKTLEAMFYATSITSSLSSSCKQEFPATAIESVSKRIRDGADVQTLYYCVSILSNLGKKVPHDTVMGLLSKALDQDDSVLSSSLGILTAMMLDTKVDIQPFLKASLDVEDMVAQADEVDEKYLHFENDLQTTSTFIRAVFQLTKQNTKLYRVTEDHVVMLANFLLRFKNPANYADGYFVVAALDSIIQYHGMKVAKVQLVSGNSVTQEFGSLKVSVTNVFNQPIEKIAVKADSVTRASDDEVIISNSPLNKVISSSVTTFNLDLWNLKPKSGFYDVTLNIVTNDGSKLVGTTDVEFKVKVTAKIDITEARIGTQERDSTAVEWKKIQFPVKTTQMKADSQQRVVMTFKVLDAVDKTLVKPHQVFVLLHNLESKKEIIFVAEPDQDSMYKFEVDLHLASKEQFAAEGGTYSIQLIIGDATISNPILWHVADIELSFPGASPMPPRGSIYAKKPEIHHLFRESEKRPPAIVSTVFTAACIAPLFILVISWVKTGLNVLNANLSPRNLAFHVGLLGIFVLYYFFWLKLNMFVTLRYLLLLGSLTFLAGNKVLSQHSAV